jgi:GNAT superfamily N-acetyltransferase
MTARMMYLTACRRRRRVFAAQVITVRMKYIDISKWPALKLRGKDRQVRDDIIAASSNITEKWRIFERPLDGALRRSRPCYYLPTMAGFDFKWDDPDLTMNMVNSISTLYNGNIPYDFTMYPYHTLACYHEDELVSVISCLIFDMNTPHGRSTCLYIAFLATEEKHQGHGLASIMLDACYESIKKPYKALDISYAFTQIASDPKANRYASTPYTMVCIYRMCESHLYACRWWYRKGFDKKTQLSMWVLSQVFHLVMNIAFETGATIASMPIYPK